jgi:hypothetical protein
MRKDMEQIQVIPNLFLFRSWYFVNWQDESYGKPLEYYA